MVRSRQSRLLPVLCALLVDKASLLASSFFYELKNIVLNTDGVDWAIKQLFLFQEGQALAPVAIS